MESEPEPEPEADPQLEPPWYKERTPEIKKAYPIEIWKLLRLILSRIFFEQRFHVDEIQKMSVRSFDMCPEPIRKILGFNDPIKLKGTLDDRLYEYMIKIGIEPTRDMYGNSYWYENSDLIEDWLEKKQKDNKELLKSEQRLAFAKFLSPRLGSHSLIQDTDVFELVQRGFEDQQYHSLSWTELNYFKELSSHFKLDLFCKFKEMAKMAKIYVFHRDIFDRTIQELNQEITKISIGLFNYTESYYPTDTYAYFSGSEILLREKSFAKKYFQNIVNTYQENEEIHQNFSLIWKYNKDFLTQFKSGKDKIFETSDTFKEYCQRKTSSIITSKNNNEERRKEKAFYDDKRRHDREMAPIRAQLELLRVLMKSNGHI